MTPPTNTPKDNTHTDFIASIIDGLTPTGLRTALKDTAKAADRAICERDHWLRIADHLLAHCKDAECSTCAEIVCPHGEPLHFHHDGCPVCYADERRADIAERERDEAREGLRKIRNAVRFRSEGLARDIFILADAEIGWEKS